VPEIVLSIVAPEEVTSLPEMPPEAIAAVVQAPDFSEGSEIPVDAVRPNRTFIEFMHHVIRTRGPRDAGLLEAASRQVDGWVYVIDLRTPEGPRGGVPPEDVVGGFEVRAGKLIAESYWPNAAHQVFTTNGLVQLPASLRVAVVEELTQRYRSLRSVNEGGASSG